MMKSIFAAVGFAVTAIILAVAGVRMWPTEAAVTKTAGQAQPLVAFVISQCNGAIGFYVVLDPTHTVLFRQQDTVVMTVENGKMVETQKEPMPFEAAMELAKRAKIQQHVVAKCPNSNPVI